MNPSLPTYHPMVEQLQLYSLEESMPDTCGNTTESTDQFQSTTGSHAPFRPFGNPISTQDVDRQNVFVRAMECHQPENAQKKMVREHRKTKKINEYFERTSRSDGSFEKFSYHCRQCDFFVTQQKQRERLFHLILCPGIPLKTRARFYMSCNAKARPPLLEHPPAQVKGWLLQWETTVIGLQTRDRCEIRRRGRGGQRVRGISRGRGSRKGGAANAATRRNGPTAGWKKEVATVHTVLSEHIFLDSYITQRVRRFVKSALQRLKLELDVKNLTGSRADVMVLMINEVIQACLKWLNEFVVLKGIEGMELSISDMYRYLAVLLYAHCSGFSMKKVIPMLESERVWSINKVVMSFIHNNLLAYAPTGRGADEAFAWNSQRDPTV